MISFLRDEFYLALATSAKKIAYAQQHRNTMEVSYRNARRVAKLREKKIQEDKVAQMQALAQSHEEAATHLKKKVKHLHTRIAQHTSGKRTLISADKTKHKISVLSSLQLSLKAVQKLAVDLHDANELSASQWTSLSEQIKRLAHLMKVQKARLERDVTLFD